MAKTNPRVVARLRRKQSIRKKVKGTAERPRLCVFCSERHIYVQVINDESGKTLAAVSTLSASVRLSGSVAANIATAAKIGTAIAEIALRSDIKRVVFDRNGFMYHGKIKALADAARAGGLEF